MKKSFYILFILIGFFLVLSIYDLFSLPLSSTCWRQTQTAMITENFVKEGFRISGLYVNFYGNSKPLMVYEFPLYNFIVGMLFYLINNNPFWGKLVSLICYIITIVFLYKIVINYYDKETSLLTCLFFTTIPIGLLMRTSFQPDSMCLMFLLISIYFILKWEKNQNLINLILFSFTLLLSGLLKFPVMVPYIPVILLIFFSSGKNLKFTQKIKETLIITMIFIVPFLLWYIYATKITEPSFLENSSSMFLFGNLFRFLTIKYYLKPAFIFIFYLFSGTGIIFFILSLKNIKYYEIIILLGILLYLIVIPTSADQHYYQFAITPVISLFMAKGFLKLKNILENNIFYKVAIFILGISYLIIFYISSQYLLRQDRIFYISSQKVNEITEKNDLILSLVLHDRVYIGARYYPEMSYMSKRKGWNLTEIEYKNLIIKINNYRERGAEYLVCTWYTSDLEPWFVNYIPKTLSRNPNIDGEKLFDLIKNNYKLIYKGKNFGILSLSK